MKLRFFWPHKTRVTLRNNVLDANVSLRSSTAGCFVPPKTRTEYFKNSLRYSGCLLWNGLPAHVKNADTLDTFHSRCIKWILDSNN